MLRSIILGLSFGCALIATSWSQDAKSAFTDPTQADADFAWQGEYEGNWGLQVIADGGGKFRATLYPGGLPGSGWNKGDPTNLQGTLENKALTLKAEKYSAVVQPGVVDLRDAQGRPIARLVKLQRVSRTMGQRPASGAVVLFDGASADKFINGKLTDDQLLRMGTMTKDKVGDFRLHLEFRLPYMPYARGQGRANSGVYIQQRYEVQILDSFGLAGLNNECGGIYTQRSPDVNLCLPPLTWQTYDIWFRQPRWSNDGKTKTEAARITVLHNGVPIHWNCALTNKTGGGKPEGPEEFPIALQDHGNPVVFRNIWMVPGQGEYPVTNAAAARPAINCCPPRRNLLRRVFARCR